MSGDGGPNLARRPDLTVGDTRILPSLRTISGPGGTVTVEPRVMQVLLALHDADGAVRTREDLVESCWGGIVVGDDSLSRAIGEVRRAVREAKAGFAIETIPRVGYRLVVAPVVAPPPVAEAQGDPPLASRPSRRALLIGGGAAAAAILAGGGIWFGLSRRTDPQVASLVDRGRQAMRDSVPARDVEAAGLLREAAARAPDDAMPWGWLALALRRIAAFAPPGRAEALYTEAEGAARHALAIDPREANAQVALLQLEPTVDRIAGEDRLREILADAPDNIAALTTLSSRLQAVGRCRESWDLNERAVALEPLVVIHQHRRALKHWIFGRTTDADQVIDGALRRWPRHPLLWHARLIISAFTGRPQAAMAQIEDADARPLEEVPAALEVWRLSLAALAIRAAPDLAAARAANLAAATRAPIAAANAVMILSSLGDLDSAYAVIEGFLLRRGPIVGAPLGPAGNTLARDPDWQRPQWLFTPATGALRADPRFPALCRDIGLADYWQRRGIRPDI